MKCVACSKYVHRRMQMPPHIFHLSLQNQPALQQPLFTSVPDRLRACMCESVCVCMRACKTFSPQTLGGIAAIMQCKAADCKNASLSHFLLFPLPPCFRLPQHTRMQLQPRQKRGQTHRHDNRKSSSQSTQSLHPPNEIRARPILLR